MADVHPMPVCCWPVCVLLTLTTLAKAGTLIFLGGLCSGTKLWLRAAAASAVVAAAMVVCAQRPAGRSTPTTVVHRSTATCCACQRGCRCSTGVTPPHTHMCWQERAHLRYCRWCGGGGTARSARAARQQHLPELLAGGSAPSRTCAGASAPNIPAILNCPMQPTPQVC